MNRVKQIYKEINKLNKELEDIRSNCPHDKYRIGLYSWRIANVDKARLCTKCDQVLGLASEEEIKEFDAENNTGQGKKVYKNTKNSMSRNDDGISTSASGLFYDTNED